MLSLIGGLAMDLGTANTLIYDKSKGIVINEPSVVALDTVSREVLAVGTEAKSYLGRAPQNIEVIRPLKSGVISDFAVTQQMIRRFLELAGAKKKLFRPKIIIGVPRGSTQMEKRAIIEAAEEAGAKTVHLVDEPMAAAIGLGLDITGPKAHMVLDIGGGTSEGGIISLGAMNVVESRRVAGDDATLAIARYIFKAYHLAIGENTAEEIKMTIASALPIEASRTFTCRGKNTTTNIPTVVEITADDVRKALEDINVEFINMAERLLAQCPGELRGDLHEAGVHLTGGGSLLKGLDQRLAKAIGLEVKVPENSLLSVVLGLGKVLEDMNFYKDIFVN